MQSSRTWTIVVIAALAVMFLPRGVVAQDAVEIDFRGGVSVPAGDLSTFVDPSPGFTVGVNYPLTERLALRFDGGADIFSGGEIDNTLVSQEGPDMSLIRFTGGLNYSLKDATEASPFLADVNVGGGIGVLTSNRRSFSGEGGLTTTVDLSELFPAAGGGLLLGYRFADQAELFASGQAYLTMADEEDLSSLGQLTEDGAPETLWSFPISVGLRFSFPE